MIIIKFKPTLNQELSSNVQEKIGHRYTISDQRNNPSNNSCQNIDYEQREQAPLWEDCHNYNKTQKNDWYNKFFSYIIKNQLWPIKWNITYHKQEKS